MFLGYTKLPLNDNNKTSLINHLRERRIIIFYFNYTVLIIHILCSLTKSEYDIKRLSYLSSDLLIINDIHVLTFVLAINETSTNEKKNVFDCLSSMRLFIVHCNFLIKIRNTEKVNKEVFFMSE